ncbi:MAG: hypothetical protein ACRD1B_01235 [Thermoanaerobaculia bacterium]
MIEKANWVGAAVDDVEFFSQLPADLTAFLSQAYGLVAFSGGLPLAWNVEKKLQNDVDIQQARSSSR